VSTSGIHASSNRTEDASIVPFNRCEPNYYLIFDPTFFALSLVLFMRLLLIFSLVTFVTTSLLLCN
jgi:hypothetical protein